MIHAEEKKAIQPQTAGSISLAQTGNPITVAPTQKPEKTRKAPSAKSNRNQRRAKKGLPPLSGRPVERSLSREKFRQILSLANDPQGLSDKNRSVVYVFLIQALTGLPKDEIPYLDLDLHRQFLTYKKLPFVPFAETSASILLDQAAGLGMEHLPVASSEERSALIDSMLRVFNLEGRLLPLFKAALSVVKSCDLEPKDFGYLSARIGISRKDSVFQEYFIRRCREISSCEQVQSFYFLPHLKPETVPGRWSLLPETVSAIPEVDRILATLSAP